MKAVGFTRYLPVSDPEAFLDIELRKPVPTGHDILVHVRAVAVNPVDTKVRAPKDKIEESPRIIGYDAPVLSLLSDQMLPCLKPEMKFSMPVI